MTDKKNDTTSEPAPPMADYASTTDPKKHPKGQAPTQSQFNGVAAPQPGTEDLPKGI